MNTTDEKLTSILQAIEGIKLHMAECEAALWEIAQKPRTGRPRTESRKKGTLADLCSVVATEFGCEATAIRGHSQVRFITRARNAFCLLAYAHTGHSYPSIARFLHRNHVTVMSGARRAQWVRVSEKSYGAKIDACEAKFTQPSGEVGGQ